MRHCVRRGRLDQIDLACEQRVGARQCFRHRHQHELVGFRNARFVPVIGVLCELGQFARHEFRQLEWSGAGWRHGELVPVLANFFVLRRAGDQKPQHLIRKQRVDGFGRHLDRRVVDLGVACDRWQPRFHLRALALVELRCLVVQHLVEIPDHCVGREVAAIVKFYALAQREAPFLFVGVIDLPFGREARHQLARPIGDVHFPRHQRVVDRVAGELITTRAAIGLTGRQRHIGHRDAIAHHRFRSRGHSRSD